MIWIVFGGIFIAIEYVIASIGLMVTIIGIPFGLQSLKLAEMALLPFDKKAVQNRISLFDDFWNNYPRKIGKQKCANWFRIHKVHKPLLDKMLNAINEQKQSEQWQRDNGQYIPHPYTWLNQGRWDDETEIDLTAKPTKEQIEAQERKEAKMAEINNKEHIALLKARFAEATPNSKYAYSLELEIQVAQGKITEEEAERKLTEYNPVDMDIPLSAIDFSAMKGIKKL